MPLYNIANNIQPPKKRGGLIDSKNKSPIHRGNMTIENFQKKVNNLEKLAKKSKKIKVFKFRIFYHFLSKT